MSAFWRTEATGVAIKTRSLPAAIGRLKCSCWTYHPPQSTRLEVKINRPLRLRSRGV